MCVDLDQPRPWRGWFVAEPTGPQGEWGVMGGSRGGVHHRTPKPLRREEVSGIGRSAVRGDSGAVIASNVFVTRSVPPHTRVTVPDPELQYRD